MNDTYAGKLGPVPTTGSFRQTNAGKSKEAKDASAAALKASSNVRDGDGESHDNAAMAHSNAGWRNRDAGNETKAKNHEKQALVHREKANQAFRAKSFASDASHAAQQLTQKAEQSAFGKDDKDPRTPKELHQDAAAAHDQAAKAHELAGDERMAKYHGAKRDAHAGFQSSKGIATP